MLSVGGAGHASWFTREIRWAALADPLCLCLRLVLRLASDSNSDFVLADLALASLGIRFVTPPTLWVLVIATLGVPVGVGVDRSFVEEVLRGTLDVLVEAFSAARV